MNMRIFGFEINRISDVEREEEYIFKDIVKSMHKIIIELVETISDSESFRFYDDENFFLYNSERHKLLLKMIDLYSSNICHSPMICYKLDIQHQKLDDCFVKLISSTHEYVKLNRILSEAMDEISNFDDETFNNEDDDIDDIISNSEKYMSMHKNKMYSIFGEYRCKVMELCEVIDTEYFKVSINYDFIKNRVHNKKAFNTRAEHNRKFFEYNIKFLADLTPAEIENQKQKIGGKSK